MKNWNDLAHDFSIWAWGKQIPNEVTELEKVVERSFKEIADKKYKITKK